jgi:hypothetical protein
MLTLHTHIARRVPYLCWLSTIADGAVL